MQKETRFKMLVQARLTHLKPLGLWYFKTQQVAVRGIPDLVLCAGGLFVTWELKTDKGRLDPLQEHTLKQISKSYGLVRVVTPGTFDAAYEELEQLLLKQRRINEPLRS